MNVEIKGFGKNYEQPNEAVIITITVAKKKMNG